MAPERPSEQELRDLILQLTVEVDESLNSDRWAIIARDMDRVAELEAAGALRHACNLAAAVVRAHRESDEFTGRILTRAIVETWLVGLFLHYGRGAAAERLAGARKRALERWQRTSDERDEILRKRVKKTKKRNEKISKANAGKELWHAQNPHLPPREPEPLLPEPDALPIELKLHGANEGLNGILPGEMHFADLVDEIRDLSAAAGEEQDPAVAFSYVYRGLSQLGAHPTLDVIDSYLDNRAGTAVFTRARAQSSLRSLAQANLVTAFLLPAQLAIKVLERRGEPPRSAVAGSRRFEQLMKAADDRPKDSTQGDG